MNVEADNSKISRADVPVKVQRLEATVEPGEASASFGRLLGRRSPTYFGGGQSFVLFKPSTGWMKPTHIMEGSLLY